MNKLGESIKQARESKGISQKNLANLLGVQIHTVWRWEKGEREPSWEMVQKIAELLNAPVLTNPVNSLSNNLSSLADNQKKEQLGLSYWGSVVDNARNVATRGNKEDAKEVLHLLELAISPLLKIIQPDGSKLDKLDNGLSIGLE